MKCTRGLIIRKRHKGMTLIEIMTALSIASILMTSVISTYIYFSKYYRRQLLKSREEANVAEAFRYMESEIRQGNKEVNFLDSIITLVRFPKDEHDRKSDCIQKDGDRLVIKYHEYGMYKATNVFLRGVNSFAVIKDMGVIIIDITTREGIRYRKCIDLNIK